MLWGGRNTANKYHWCVWGVLAVYGPHWVCPSSWSMCFPGLHCSGSRLLYRELSKAGPGFCALPRSKLLRFGFLGAPQRQTNLGMIFVPFPGLSSSGKKVFGKPTLPGGWCILITSLVPATQFPGCTVRAPSQVCHMSPLGS